MKAMSTKRATSRCDKITKSIIQLCNLIQLRTMTPFYFFSTIALIWFSNALIEINTVNCSVNAIPAGLISTKPDLNVNAFIL